MICHSSSNLHDKVAAEKDEILKYKKEQEEKGRFLSRNEAAQEWINRNAERFHQVWRE